MKVVIGSLCSSMDARWVELSRFYIFSCEYCLGFTYFLSTFEHYLSCILNDLVLNKTTHIFPTVPRKNSGNYKTSARKGGIKISKAIAINNHRSCGWRRDVHLS